LAEHPASGIDCDAVLAGVTAGAFWLAVSIALQMAFGERFAAGFTGSRADHFARRVTRS